MIQALFQVKSVQPVYRSMQGAERVNQLKLCDNVTLEAVNGDQVPDDSDEKEGTELSGAHFAEGNTHSGKIELQITNPKLYGQLKEGQVIRVSFDVEEAEDLSHLDAPPPAPDANDLPLMENADKEVVPSNPTDPGSEPVEVPTKQTEPQPEPKAGT